MLHKVKLSKLVNIPKLIHTLFILLWIILIILLVMKFLFNQWYPIVIKNEAYINVCNFIDTHKWAYYSITYISFNITDYIWILAASRKKYIKNVKINILIAIMLTSCYLVKSYNMLVGNLLELMSLIGIPILLNVKEHRFDKKCLNILFPIIIYALVNVWQLNILLIRDVQSILSNSPTLVGMTMQIDYYIFIIILYGEVNLMGLWGGWFFCRNKTALLAIKEAELKKAKPNKKVIDEVDKRLAKMKND